MRNNNHIDFSVIIPVLNEAPFIDNAIENVLKLTKNYSIEIIVVDGDPDGSTIAHVQNKNVKKLVNKKGRALQMNAGSELAHGDILLFLHADTLLPENAFSELHKIKNSDRFDCGAFSLDFDVGTKLLTFIAFMANMRTKIFRKPFGDQALFIKKDFFKQVGRFSPIPLMEDVDIIHKIKKHNGRIYISNKKVITSARKWKTKGIRNTVNNWYIQFLYFCGVTPERLAKKYYKQ